MHVKEKELGKKELDITAQTKFANEVTAGEASGCFDGWYFEGRQPQTQLSWYSSSDSLLMTGHDGKTSDTNLELPK